MAEVQGYKYVDIRPLGC